MKMTGASRYLIGAVFCGAVFFLVLGNLAAAGAQPKGCSHCRGTGPGIVSGQCCCPSGMPGQCGSCGHGGMSLCRCSSGSPAFIAAPVAAIPAWHISLYVHPLASVSSKLIPPNIFHPPELSHFALYV
jgi:hypothetical protein